MKVRALVSVLGVSMVAVGCGGRVEHRPQIDWMHGPVVIGPIETTTDLVKAAPLVSAVLPAIADLGPPRIIEIADPTTTKPDRETVALQFIDRDTPVWLVGYPADGMTFEGRLHGAGGSGSKVDLAPGRAGILEVGSGGDSMSVTWFVGAYAWNLVVPPDTLSSDEVVRLAREAAASQGDPAPTATPTPIHLGDATSFAISRPDEPALALGRHGIWMTTDRGVSWRSVGGSFAKVGTVVAARFFDAGSGVAFTAGGDPSAPTLDGWLTSDGGATWTVARLDLVSRTNTPPVSATFTDTPNGVVVSVWYQMGGASAWSIVLETTDRGASWKELGRSPGRRGVSVDGDRYWIAGGAEQQTLYESTDVARTWRAVPGPAPDGSVYGQPQIEDGATSVFAIRATAGDLALYTSSDAGATWTERGSTKVDAGVASTAPVTAAVAGTGWLVWAGSSRGFEIASPDGTFTPFRSVGLLEGDAPIAFQVGPSGTGWLIAVNGVCDGFKTSCHSGANLYVTSDGGATWSVTATLDVEAG